MNIIFWSPVRGHGAVSSNMTCLSIMSSLVYGCKTVFFETGFSNPGLNVCGIPIRDRTDSVNEEFSYYVGKGMEGILNNINMESFHASSIQDYCSELIRDKCYMVEPWKGNCIELYRDKIKNYLGKFIHFCNDAFDLTCMEIGPELNDGLEEIFKSASVCVVNVSQNPEVLEYSKSQLRNTGFCGKIIYVIGRYDSNSRFSVKSISKKCRIHMNDIGVVPYNIGFFEASLRGKVSEFMKCNLGCSKRSENYYFMNEIRSLTDKILGKAGVEIGSF